MKKKILICGAPTVGKSTMAGLLSKHFELPWISTDQIRDIMRTVADPEQQPDLFNAGHETAESFLAAYSATEIAEMEIAQGRAVWPGVKEFIDTDYTWVDGFIIEGVNLLPELIAKEYSESDEVKAVVLVDNDTHRMRKGVFERGLWGDAKTYSDDVKEKEVEWAAICSQMLQKQAEAYNIPVVEVSKEKEADLDKVLEALDFKNE